MPTIKGGFRIINGKMDKESRKKFEEATGKSIRENFGFKTMKKEVVIADKKKEKIEPVKKSKTKKSKKNRK